MFIIRCSSFIIRCFSLGPICLWFFSFFNIFTDFSFVSSVLFFSFFSRFLFTFCSVSLSFVTVVVATVCLEFQIFCRIFQLFFFFKSFRLFTLCPISLVTLIIFLYRLAISSYRFFFVIFHDFFWSFYIQVFSIETMWYFFYRLGFFVTYAHVITALCRRWKIIMSITHVENNNQARYEAIRRVCLWRVQMRVIVHCATFSHNISN